MSYAGREHFEQVHKVRTSTLRNRKKKALKKLRKKGAASAPSPEYVFRPFEGDTKTW